MVVKLFHVPFNMILSGPSSSGKSYWLYKLFLNIDNILTKVPNRIVFCYQYWQTDLYPALEHIVKQRISFIKGLPENIETELQNSNNTLLIIDDLQNELKNREDILNVFTRGGHHNCISTILITQNLFSDGRIFRELRWNAHYVVIMRSPRDITQVDCFARQIVGKGSKRIVDIYKKITHGKRYSYMVFNLHPKNIHLPKVLTDIFSNKIRGWYLK